MKHARTLQWLLLITPTTSSIDLAKGNCPPYVAGLIQTDGLEYVDNGQGRFSQCYGHFRMRAKLLADNGVGAAFWLLPYSQTGGVISKSEVQYAAKSSNAYTQQWQLAHLDHATATKTSRGPPSSWGRAPLCRRHSH